jgi:DNA-binding transcriptional LysR family regulator
VTFGQLLLYRDILQARSISRGAAARGISQSAASQQLQELERQLGVELLDRSTRPFTVTPAGRLYGEFCRDVLRRKEEFEAALALLKTEVEGTVRVASIYSVGLSEMSQLQQEFLRRHGKARLEVEYLRPDKVYEAVLADSADLGLVSYPVCTKDIVAIPWREEVMVVAAAQQHPLARLAQAAARDLEGVEFVAFDEELPIRREIDRFLRERGVEVRITMHFDNIQMIKEAVALGTVVSILPARLLAQDQRIRAIPLEGGLVRPLGIIHRRRKKFHRAALAFMQLLQEQPLPAPA